MAPASRAWRRLWPAPSPPRRTALMPMATPSLAPSSRSGPDVAVRGARRAAGAARAARRGRGRRALPPRACAAASRRARRPRAMGARSSPVATGRAWMRTWGRSRSQPAARARASAMSSAAVVERLEERADQVLGGQALDVLGVAQREGGLVGHGLQQLLVLGREGAHAASAWRRARRPRGGRRAARRATRRAARAARPADRRRPARAGRPRRCAATAGRRRIRAAGARPR